MAGADDALAVGDDDVEAEGRAVERGVVGKVGSDCDVEAERRVRVREALNGDASERRATSASAQVAAECRAGLPNFFVDRVVRSSPPVHFSLVGSFTPLRVDKNAAIPKNKKLTPCFAAFGDECSTHGERVAKSPCHVVFNTFCTF